MGSLRNPHSNLHTNGRLHTLFKLDALVWSLLMGWRNSDIDFIVPVHLLTYLLTYLLSYLFTYFHLQVGFIHRSA